MRRPDGSRGAVVMVYGDDGAMAPMTHDPPDVRFVAKYLAI
jgi:hypothetical protein